MFSKDEIKLLREGCAHFDFKVSETLVENLSKLIDLLLEWNEKVNVTAITDRNEFIEKHLVDSLALLPYLKKKNIMDIGSGGGFPGLPVALSDSTKNIFMVDSKNKKINIINDVIQKLELKNAEAVWAHMPEKKVNKKFDHIVSRGTFKASAFLNASIQNLKLNGSLILMKGKLPTNELELSTPLEQKLKLKRTIHQYHLPFSQADRCLIIWGR